MAARDVGAAVAYVDAHQLGLLGTDAGSVRLAPVISGAVDDDVAGICRFGETHVRAHYEPLIGTAAADDQVRRWWNAEVVGAAVRAGMVVVATVGGEVVGVGQRGHDGDADVVYKLYVHPSHRGRGLGRRLLRTLIEQLPADADRLWIEHFAANERAGAFYEREGFAVERVEPSPGGDPRTAVVWRSRRLTQAGPPGPAP